MTELVPTTTYPDAQQADYLEKHSVAEPDPFLAARQLAMEQDMPALDPSSATLLAILVRLASPHDILEVGSGAGISGAQMLLHCEHARLTTIDIDPVHTAIATRLYEAVGVADRVKAITADAVEVLATLDSSRYDLMLIDTAKSQIMTMYEQAQRLLAPDGLLVVDNQWWSGRVVDSAFGRVEDVETSRLNDVACTSSEWVGGLIPVGDGLLVLTRTGRSSDD